ncbi:MAG: polyprenyl synthetase family protein [Alphaproteobacteria bacterium]|nr:polyprenyl synthetase family protein [Alphaproteobacteria bacterium]
MTLSPALHHSSAGTPNAFSFEDIRGLIASDLAAVDQRILSLAEKRAPLIGTLLHHILSSGGKRLRPMLTLLSAQAFNYKGQYHIDLAASIEFIHTATLLHDDVVDGSMLRRGKPTANDVWGNKASILVGDFLLSQAFELMVGTGSISVLDILSRTSSIISEGEVLQLSNERNLRITEDTYIHIITAKTAALFSAACEVGAVIANRASHEQAAMADYGLNLGIAFQIADDTLDYSAEQAKLGKTVGDDFREGKVTLPIILALKQATPTEELFWHQVITTGEQHQDDLQVALKLLQEKNIIEASLDIAKDYVNKALQSLANMPASPAKDAMLLLAQFAVNRAY